MPHAALKAYLNAIEQTLKAGNATEHTHRPALEALLEALGGPEVDAINEPRQPGFEDVMHYHEVAAALARTLELQAALGDAVSARGGWPLS